MTGYHRTNHGSPWSFLVTRLTASYLPPAPLSELVTAERQASRSQAGSKGGDLRTSHPLLYVKSKKKNRVVADALHDNNWIRDLDHRTGFTVQYFIQFATQWNLIPNVHLLDNQDDSITWKLTASGVYTAVSAYRAQILGCTKAPRIYSIWKTWVLPKAKFFTWLITQDRVWTSDRLARRGWDHSPSCPLCRATVETSHHLMSECRYTRRIWDQVATWVALPGLRPSNWKPSSNTLEW